MIWIVITRNVIFTFISLAPLSDKFLHRKKQKKISTTRTIMNNTTLQTETASLKKNVLELQQQFLQQEIKMKAETHKLNTEVLSVELEIKKLQLQRL